MFGPGIDELFLAGTGAFSLITSLLGIAAYVLTALSLYTISKRRGNANPWLAWIPVAQDYLLGDIVDRLDARQGKNRKWRLILLWLAVATLVLAVVVAVTSGWMIYYLDAYSPVSSAYSTSMYGSIVQFTIAVSLCTLVAIAYSVVAFMCYFRVFESCRPGKETLYLLLGILVPYALPIVLMLCRQYESGILVPTVPPYPNVPPAGAPYTNAPAAGVAASSGYDGQPYAQLYQQPVYGVPQQQYVYVPQNPIPVEVPRSGPIGTSTGFTVAPAAGQHPVYEPAIPQPPASRVEAAGSKDEADGWDGAVDSSGVGGWGGGAVDLDSADGRDTAGGPTDEKNDPENA